MIKKISNQRWQVDIQPGGRTGPRIKRIFKTESEAKQFENWATAQHVNDPEWKPKKPDQRRLKDLLKIWWEQHGCQLSAGDDTYSRLKTLADRLENPPASKITAEMFAKYRTARLEEGISANTINREHAYLRSVFNELARLGNWKKENPLKLIRQFKLQEKELSFLSFEQIKALLTEIENGRNPHTLLVTKICLCTGARWSEAEGLTVKRVRSQHVHFSDTKGKKVRSVPITEQLEKEIKNHVEKLKRENRIFDPAFSSFRSAVDRSKIKLPDGQLTHVLRHTFASHFIMNGGNILALQKLLGHQSLTMTMRYAHLSPEHLAEARTLNPLATIKKSHTYEAS